MRKQTIMALALFVSAFSFAQKKELKTAEKSINANNFSAAMKALKQVEPMVKTLDEKTKNKYYYLKGAALFANGAGSYTDNENALSSLDQIKGDDYEYEIETLKKSMIKNFVAKSNSAYENKDYTTASINFEYVYNINKKDTVYLYYAAASAISAPDYPRALKLYTQLKDLGYEGKETKYYAWSKKNKENEAFPNKELRDVAVEVKKSHFKPTEEYTNSKKPEILKRIALIYANQDDSKRAIKAINEALVENPTDSDLLSTQANLYYNLGVVAASSNDIESAKKHYTKAIELNPNFTNAYNNLGALVLAKEATLVEEMNSLGNSKADAKKYEELKIKRQEVYKKAIPYYEKVLAIDKNNDIATKTLMNIYIIMGEKDKYNALKSRGE